MSARGTSRAAAPLAAMLAVGCYDGIVGGECARGFIESDGTCVSIQPEQAAGSVGSGPGVTAIEPRARFGGSDGGGGSNSSSSAGGASGSGGSATGGGSGDPCDPLVACDGVCVDLSSDPQHCGACGEVCATDICIEGACTGASVGHLVTIGMDYSAVPPSSPAAVLLGNAVLVPPVDPVRVLQVRTYSEAPDQPPPAGVATLLTGEAAARGRSISWLDDASAAQIPAKLAASDVDVLLVHDQDHAPTGLLAAIGTWWAPAIESFAKNGGVVVVLATGAGTGQMDDLLTNGGILDVTDFTDVTGQAVDNIGWLDVLGQNVLSPFLAKVTSASFVTTASPSVTTSFVVTSATGAPLAVHRVVLGD